MDRTRLTPDQLVDIRRKVLDQLIYRDDALWLLDEIDALRAEAARSGVVKRVWEQALQAEAAHKQDRLYAMVDALKAESAEAKENAECVDNLRQEIAGALEILCPVFGIVPGATLCSAAAVAKNVFLRLKEERDRLADVVDRLDAERGPLLARVRELEDQLSEPGYVDALRETCQRVAEVVKDGPREEDDDQLEALPDRVARALAQRDERIRELEEALAVAIDKTDRLALANNQNDFDAAARDMTSGLRHALRRPTGSAGGET